MQNAMLLVFYKAKVVNGHLKPAESSDAKLLNVTAQVYALF